MPVAASINQQPGLGLNEFQQTLVGTWTNQPFPNTPNGEGGPDNPLSFNVMPLPQASADVGYIPFEEREANVTTYQASYWLLADDDDVFRYLAYTQTIDMTLTVNRALYVFPHVTCNVVTKQAS